MTVYLNIDTTLTDEWRHFYWETADILGANRVGRQSLSQTIQGSWNLIIDVDTANIISQIETVTVACSRFWQVLPSLEPPAAQPGRVYLKEDLDDGQAQAYFTNADYSIFYARFGEPKDQPKLQHIKLGEHIIFDITQAGMLAGLWMLNLPSEIQQERLSSANA